MTTERIEAFWQDATADDVARVMAGETVEARFRDLAKGNWLESDHSLGGYDSTEEVCKWISSTGCPWRFCQVYREPAWWTNKPDPGPGHRLLGKFPDEPVAVGDEFFKSGKWYETCRPDRDSQDRTGWYRRRIEPVEVVEPDVLHYVLLVGESAKLPNGQTITITEKGFEVKQ